MSEQKYDRWFLLAVTGLVCLGFVMVTSASLAFAENIGLSAWHFSLRQGLYLLVGILLLFFSLSLPLAFWRTFSAGLLLGVIALLALLLVPGISREVNGSVRWLFLGPISIQVSELAKLSIIIYMADYLVRKEKEIRTEIGGFLKPLSVVALISLLLLLEPDFGATVVIVSTVMGMLFLGGVPFRNFMALLLLAVVALGALSVASPYRMQRLTSFLDPWSDQFNSGYQLTQSLIAFGRGGWLGSGLGSSVQKLLYLPEPHTDFIYAVLAEELGLVGALLVLLLFVLLVWRILEVGRRAITANNRFAGFMAYGIGLWFGLQCIINIGVNTGVLPTKGLTLPFMSYGGSSLMVSLLAIGILLRIEYEMND
jgi:cell division protein FtsW